jgi:hypothetical protein
MSGTRNTNAKPDNHIGWLNNALAYSIIGRRSPPDATATRPRLPCTAGGTGPALSRAAPREGRSGRARKLTTNTSGSFLGKTRK